MSPYRFAAILWAVGGVIMATIGTALTITRNLTQGEALTNLAPCWVFAALCAAGVIWATRIDNTDDVGTPRSKGHDHIVGEQGPEMVTLPDGRWLLHMDTTKAIESFRTSGPDVDKA